MARMTVLAPSYAPGFALCAELNRSIQTYVPGSVDHEIVVPRADLAEVIVRSVGATARATVNAVDVNGIAVGEAIDEGTLGHGYGAILVHDRDHGLTHARHREPGGLGARPAGAGEDVEVPVIPLGGEIHAGTAIDHSLDARGVEHRRQRPDVPVGPLHCRTHILVAGL